MNPGWPFAALLDATTEAVTASRVDCGTCPVSIQCVLSDGGTGWRYSCCGSAGIYLAGNVVLVLDCQRNTFQQRDNAEEVAVCPLCNGDFVTGHVLGLTEHHRYVPTVHAKVPVKTRLALWHKTLPEAIELKRRVDEVRLKK